MKKTRLLVVRCGERKSPKKGKIPALQRYKGQLFNTINNALKERSGFFTDTDIKVFILSAEFGLISGDEKIPLYNRKIDQDRAKELRPSTLYFLKQLSFKIEPEEILLLLSSSYGDVLCPSDIEKLWPDCKLTSLNWSHQSTKQLGEWLLYGEIQTHDLLTRDEIAEIRRLREEGTNMAAIGKFFNRSTACIANIVHNRTYKIK
jgi:hypothetical protein